jgi:uncharacterized protein
MSSAITLKLFPEKYSICRLAPQEALPDWALKSGFVSITRTARELSVVCLSDCVPAEISHEGGWRMFEFQGPFAFTQTGILASVLDPLARAEVGILALSTFDTDYLLVKEERLADARTALVAANHIMDSR